MQYASAVGLDCTEWLPDELCDFILNGIDSRNVPFVHPTQRFLLRLVCARWRTIVEHPSPQWADGHLLDAWRRMPCTQVGSDARSFVTGRVLTFVGGVLFGCGPAWTVARLISTPLLPTLNGSSESFLDAGEQRDARVKALDQEASERIEAYFDLIGRRHYDGEDWCHAMVTVAIRMMGAPVTSLPTACDRCLVARSVACVLVAMDRPLVGLDYFVRHVDPDADPTSYAKGLFWFMCAVAHRGRDEAPTLLAALDLFARSSAIDFNVRDNCRRGAERLWRALAQTQSLASIRALVAGLQGTLDDALWETTRTLLHTLSNVLSNGRIMGWHLAMCHLLRETRKPGFATSLDDLFNREHWLHMTAHIPHPALLLEAHGASLDHIKPVVYTLAQRGRYADADPVMALALQRHGAAAVFDDSRFLPSIIGCSESPADAVRWATRHGYQPRPGHTSQLVTHVISKAYARVPSISLMAAMANVWPAQVMAEPNAFARILARMIECNAWDDAKRVIRMLMPIALPTIMHIEPADALPEMGDATDVRDDTSNDHGDILGIMRDGDDGAEWEVAPSEYIGSARPVSLWDGIRSGQTSVLRLDYVTHEGKIGVTYNPTRTQVLARLAHHYDPQTCAPLEAAAWRFWCGPPMPIRPNERERAFLYLVGRGLVGEP